MAGAGGERRTGLCPLGERCGIDHGGGLVVGGEASGLRERELSLVAGVQVVVEVRRWLRKWQG